jgi:hypothetical protein
MPFRVLVTFGLAAHLASAVQAAPPSRLDDLPPVGPDYQPSSFRGRIVGFTKTGVVVKPEGTNIELDSVMLGDGPTKTVKWVAVYRQDNTRPPRQFLLGDCLFPDRPGSKTARVGEHQVTELRVGDIVSLCYSKPVGVEVCTYITICRRPGGKVPPAIYDESFDGKYYSNRHDVRCNAAQFVEESVPVILPRLVRSIRP